jgi:hypothetical protein
LAATAMEPVSRVGSDQPQRVETSSLIRRRSDQRPALR